MSEYQIQWTREEWFKVTIEAENDQEAMDMFLAEDYEHEQMYGSEIQDSIEIVLINDEFGDD
jgi:hypothetical protein